MKKAEIKIYVEQLVEAGKGLAYASMMEEGRAKEAAEELLFKTIDDTCKQLELYCEDVDFAFIEEMLEDGKIEQTTNQN